nr:MAG: hypothetical protein [Molluscum contagiosum virus]
MAQMFTAPPSVEKMYMSSLRASTLTETSSLNSEK